MVGAKLEAMIPADIIMLPANMTGGGVYFWLKGPATRPAILDMAPMRQIGQAA